MTVQKANPTKQGLKLWQPVFVVPVLQLVQKANPTKQGLKLVFIGLSVGLGLVQKANPTKQGLKPWLR